MEARSTQRPVRVFISYAHGSVEHMEQVRDLWLFLHRRGIDAKLDMPAAEVPQDWALWMVEQVRKADYVLVIASEAYRRRADGLATPKESRGVVFESGLVREAMYADPVAARRKFLPVVLGDGRLEDIPSFLGQTSTTHYRIAALTEKHAEPLLRVLTGQPLVSEPELGPPRTLNGLQVAAHPLVQFVNAASSAGATADRLNGNGAAARATAGSNGRGGGRGRAEPPPPGNATTGAGGRDRAEPAQEPAEEPAQSQPRSQPRSRAGSASVTSGAWSICCWPCPRSPAPRSGSGCLTCCPATSRTLCRATRPAGKRRSRCCGPPRTTRARGRPWSTRCACSRRAHPQRSGSRRRSGDWVWTPAEPSRAKLPTDYSREPLAWTRPVVVDSCTNSVSPGLH